MRKWEMVRLGDVASFNMGQSPSSDSYNNTGEGLPFFQGKTDFGIMYPTVRIYCTKPKKTADKYDILISVRAPVGTVNIATELCCIGRGLAAISQIENISNFKYLYYYLQYKENEIARMGVGSTFKAISKKDLDAIEIPLPPLPVQQKIADVLDRANALIEKRKAQLEKLDLLAKSQFIQMFDENYGTIELKEICSIITDGTHQPPKFVDYGIPFIFVSNIVNNEILYETNKYISEDDYKTLIKRTPLEIGDLLLTTVGSYGNPAIVKTTQKFCFQRHIAYIKPINEIVNTQYLHTAFLCDLVKRQIDRKVKGVAQKTLNLSDLKTIRIMLPPLHLQNQFAAYVEQVEAQKALIKQSLELMELEYKSLMQMCFNGELY
ncbi:MAG: restriction endonuclease subunit S [Oscillospiraceae bacterium]|nr:restriction endonuclease subunit S [Oscillospiraceae bacterium]